MKTLVIYDISNDKCRNSVVESCKDYGLKRIQYSCFLGDLNRNKRQELGMRLKRVLLKAGGDVQVIPLCDKDLASRLHLHVEPKKDEG